MLPNKSTFITFVLAIGLIEARIPRQYHNEPRNGSTYTYGGYYGGRNSKPLDDRFIDDDDDLDDLNDEKDSPYLWNREEYPNPILQPPFCRNKHPSHICDPDDILTRTQKLSLEKTIRRINTDVNCYCANCTIDSNGITIGIALMRAMHKPYLKHPRDYVEEYAEYLRKKWNLGICDNDMVLLISTTDRMRYPALGKTARDVIPPKVITKLMNETKTDFASSLYRGLDSLVNGLHEELIKLQTVEESTTSQPTKLDEPEEESNIALVLGLTFLILVLLILSIFCIIFLVKWKKGRSRSYQPGQQSDTVKRDPEAEVQPAERREADEVDEDEENNNQEAQEAERRVQRSWLQPVTSSIRESWTQVKAISFKKKRTSGGSETVQTEYQTVETTESRTAPKATEEEDEEEQFDVPEEANGKETAEEEDPKTTPVYTETTKPLQSSL